MSKKQKGPRFPCKHYTFIILGASGDLSKRKIFPSLYGLYISNNFPSKYTIIGFSRSDLSREMLKERALRFLEKVHAKYLDMECFKEKVDLFYEKVVYVKGFYDNEKDFVKLSKIMKEKEKENVNCEVSRVFYFSLPPHIFMSAASYISKTCKCDNNVIILEKPFGTDTKSYLEIQSKIENLFKKKDIYRIDHYIGKEVVQDLITLRFANTIFDYIWSRNVIKNVQIVFKEKIDIQGRGAYFDQYGIVRDVMQNHMLQVLALLSMEPPVSLEKEDIVAEKIKVLKSVEPVKLENTCVGQYKGYTEDSTVPDESITPTFCSCVLFIKNRRWDGVPFMLKAGKGINENLVQVTITFKEVPAFLFKRLYAENYNKLVIRIQPDEAMYFEIQNKVPGLHENRLKELKLDFTYHECYKKKTIPDAYERLILNAMEREAKNFVHPAELKYSWNIFDQLLHDLEENVIPPKSYTLGSSGPKDSDYLVTKFDQRWNDE